MTRLLFWAIGLAGAALMLAVVGVALAAYARGYMRGLREAGRR